MRISSTLTAALAVGAAASSWFSKPAYNKWDDSELVRWLDDHDVPHPTSGDHKELEKLVENNWNKHVVEPYRSWSTDDMMGFLKAKGVETKSDAEAAHDDLASRVKTSWYETEDQAQSAWTSVKDWIFDSWSDSAVKAFCDRHDIPVPQPQKRDTLLQKARSNYDSVAKKLGETTSYPGDWLYSTWSDSDLKEWLDTHGVSAPQPSNRDKLVSSVRRNSRLAYLRMQELSATASASARSAYATVSDAVLDSWSESDVKEFLDRNGVPVPQGTKANEMRALVRKHRAETLGDTVAGRVAAGFTDATDAATGEFAKATDTVTDAARSAFDQAVGTWSESRLKAYLDARGVPVPHASRTDELRALVRKHSHKAASGWSAWSFDDYSVQNLKDYLTSQGDAAAKTVAGKTSASRDELVNAAQSAYSSASSAGGSQFASATSYLTQATAGVKQGAWDSWSESDLKSYLDSYGIPVPQASTIDEIRAMARRQGTYFKYGTTTPSGTLLAKVEEGFKGVWDWAASHLRAGADAAEKKAAQTEEEVEKAAHKAKEEL